MKRSFWLLGFVYLVLILMSWLELSIYAPRWQLLAVNWLFSLAVTFWASYDLFVVEPAGRGSSMEDAFVAGAISPSRCKALRNPPDKTDGQSQTANPKPPEPHAPPTDVSPDKAEK